MSDEFAKEHGWNRLELVYKIGLITFLIFPIIMIFVLIRIYGISPLFAAILVICVTIPVQIFWWKLYQQRKDVYIKNFQFEDSKIIVAIEKALTQNSIGFRRSNTGAVISEWPLKFAEIFDIYELQLFIKVHTSHEGFTGVVIGPIRPDNDLKIQNLMKILKEAFVPNILNSPT